MIITGGTSLLPGFSERTVTELREQCAEQMYKLKPVAAGFAQERRFSTWIGGSILASLGTFQQLWYVGVVFLCVVFFVFFLKTLFIPKKKDFKTRIR